MPGRAVPAPGLRAAFEPRTLAADSDHRLRAGVIPTRGHGAARAAGDVPQAPGNTSPGPQLKRVIKLEFGFDQYHLVTVPVGGHGAHETRGWGEPSASDVSPARSIPGPSVLEEAITRRCPSAKQQYRVHVRIPGHGRTRSTLWFDRGMGLHPLMVGPEPGLGAEVHQDDLPVTGVVGKDGEQAEEGDAGRR